MIDRRTFLGAAATGLILPAPAGALSPEAATWQPLPTVPYRGKQDDIAFATPLHGWYGNGEGRLYGTADGGDSWTPLWHRPGTFVRALGFIDREIGILGNVGVGAFPGVEDETALYRTGDGGRSWRAITRIEGPAPRGICAIDIVRHMTIDRGEAAHGLVVHAAGRVGGPAHYLRSFDSGDSWVCEDLGRHTAAIFDVQFIDRRTGFIAGTTSPDLTQTRALILRTDDGGDSWAEVYRGSRPFETVWKLSLPSPRIGYGSVQSYDPDRGVTQRWVAKSIDGGRSWSELPLIEDAAWRSFGIGFADENIGWVGGPAMGLETRDGGASWSPAALGRAVNKIRFVGEGTGRRAYAIGTGVHRLDLAGLSR